MPRRWIYLVLSLAGTIVPMTQFVPWARTHGLSFRLFWQELFASNISSFLTLDLVLTFLTVVLLAVAARKRTRFWWLPVLACACIGVSAGLPLLLFLAGNESPAPRP